MLARWIRFNAIGILGAGVQLSALWILTATGANYLAATAMAVEAAVLHNYFWHRRWTWAGRPLRGTLWRFHVSNGLLSLACNLTLMRVLTGHFALAPVPANLCAITLTSLVNFALGERWVFARQADSTATSVLSLVNLDNGCGAGDLACSRLSAG